jgi:hypothetical protein
VLLALLQLLMPSVSLVGHLSGLLTGERALQRGGTRGCCWRCCSCSCRPCRWWATSPVCSQVREPYSEVVPVGRACVLPRFVTMAHTDTTRVSVSTQGVRSPTVCYHGSHSRLAH